MKSTKYVLVDVFTKKPLSGNPLAVFTEASEIEPSDMQKIARELNLSETTFVLPPKSGGDVHVRIFTPVNELPFAGHPTLGTVFVLGNMTEKQTMTIETAMGSIPFSIKRLESGEIHEVEMEQPIPIWREYKETQTLLEGLGLHSSTLPVEIYRNGPRHVFVGLPSISALSAIKPDLRILEKLEDVAANCFARDGDHWRMRMFSPAYGVAEDAATGSAAGPLALHLARHGKVNFGDWIEIHQGVEMGRCSIMNAKVITSEEEIKSISVSGSAVIIAEGNFLRW